MPYNILYNVPCYFQYISQRGNLDIEIKNRKFLNYSIEMGKDMSIYYLMTHCRWLSGSAFTTTKPIDVNEKFIKSFVCLQKFFVFA